MKAVTIRRLFKFALLALGICVGTSSPAADATDRAPAPSHKSNPTFWAKGGWRDLRWGMGPGDVAERVQKMAGLRWTYWTTAAELSRRSGTESVGVQKWWGGLADPNAGELTAYLSEESLEWEGSAHLRFGTSGLQAIIFEDVVGRNSNTATAETASRRFDATLRRLSASLGRPNCRAYADGRTCEWRSGAVRTQLRQFTGWGEVVGNLVPVTILPSASLAYEDPRTSDPQTRRLASADVAVRTDPARWSQLGIDGIRLGMGLGDVLHLLKERATPLECRPRTTGGPSCSGGCLAMCEKSDGEIHCELGEGCALTPTGLSMRQLKFSEAALLAQAQFWMSATSRDAVSTRFVEIRNAMSPVFAEYDRKGVVWSDGSFLFGLAGPGPLMAGGSVVELSPESCRRISKSLGEPEAPCDGRPTEWTMEVSISTTEHSRSATGNSRPSVRKKTPRTSDTKDI